MGGSPVDVALYVARALESCGVRYVVGGSLASSISGEPRSTLDVDIVVEMSEADVPRVAAALEPEFEVDDRAVTRAVRARSSVNAFHRSTAIKVDLFIAGGTPLDDEQMERRLRIRVGDTPAQHLFVYTPEDILLQKLRWFRLGNEVSDRQWRDILDPHVSLGRWPTSASDHESPDPSIPGWQMIDFPRQSNRSALWKGAAIGLAWDHSPSATCLSVLLA